MNAKKCDVCGVFYEVVIQKGAYTVIDEAITVIRNALKGDEEEFSEMVAGVCDLCPDCKKSLTEWYKARVCRDK